MSQEHLCSPHQISRDGPTPYVILSLLTPRNPHDWEPRCLINDGDKQPNTSSSSSTSHRDPPDTSQRLSPLQRHSSAAQEELEQDQYTAASAPCTIAEMPKSPDRSEREQGRRHVRFAVSSHSERLPTTEERSKRTHTSDKDHLLARVSQRCPRAV